MPGLNAESLEQIAKDFSVIGRAEVGETEIEITLSLPTDSYYVCSMKDGIMDHYAWFPPVQPGHRARAIADFTATIHAEIERSN